MTILDFKEQREARRRDEWESWVASQDRKLAEIQRVVDKLAPFFDQLLKQKKVRAPPAVRGARVLEHDHDSPPGAGSHFRRCPGSGRIVRRAFSASCVAGGSA